MQFVAFDSQAVADDRAEYLLIHRHYNALLQRFPTSRFIFIPENNLGLESAHLDTMVADLRDQRVETFWETDKRAGVHKDNEATRGYQFLTNLALSRRQIKLARTLQTVTPDATPDSMIELLEKQMLCLHWERRETNGGERFKLTGKMGSTQDDLLICVMMVLYWGRIYFNSRSAK